MVDLGLFAVHAALAMDVSRSAHSTSPLASRATLEPGGIVAFDPTALLNLAVGSPLPTSLLAGIAALTQESPRVYARMVLLSKTESSRGVFFQCVDAKSPLMHASLYLREGRLCGAVYGRDSVRTVFRSLESGVSSARVEDANRDLPCGGADLDFVAPPEPLLQSNDGGVAEDGGVADGAMCDDGGTVDVLVVYTDAAVAQAGSETALLDEISWVVADSNAIYAGSGVMLTARLVGTARLNGFVEDSANLMADLNALTTTNDGVLDAVHTLRDAHDADLVALVRADSPLSCGVAWIMQENSSAQSTSGFSVTALGCFANRTFTHELAHNMGCCHAPNDGGGCSHNGGVFPYAKGHRFTGDDGVDYRTVMAYAPGARIPRFSSPLQYWAGVSTGIIDECDNSRTIDETRFAFTNYRCSPPMASCGSPLAGDCCTPHIEPFCSDAACCAFVCAQDAYCCESTWDARCAESARSIFVGCCVTDLDGDATTGASDLAALLSAWGTDSVDFDESGVCDAADLATLLASWGSCL